MKIFCPKNGAPSQITVLVENKVGLGGIWRPSIWCSS